MARVFVTRRLPGAAVERLRAHHEVEVWEESGPPPREDLLERTQDADALLCLLTDRVDAELFDRCPRLRIVANMAVGFDNIDLQAATLHGVAVGNTPGVLTEATADLTFALILAAARRLPEGIEAVRHGRWGPWDPSWLLGLELTGATLGLVGKGRIGAAVAHRAEAFGMQVLFTDLGSGVPLRTVLEQSDVVSLHVPLTEETEGMIDAAALSWMRPTAIVINTARGPIVDQTALAEALQGGRLGAAALDVTVPEPLPPDHPLLGAPNLLVLPHLGSATTVTRARMADLAVDNVLAGLAGKSLPNPVVQSGAGKG